MEKTLSRLEILFLFKAIDELQPQQAQSVLSDYDVGVKVAYGLGRTADFLDPVLKPFRKVESAYWAKRQEIEQKIKEKKTASAEKAKLRKELKSLQVEFESARRELLEETEQQTIKIHSVELSKLSDKCRTPAWWVWDTLRDFWILEEASEESKSMTLGQALELRQAVAIYLHAPRPDEIEDYQKNADKRFPVDVGIRFASKLFTAAELVRRVIEPHLDEVDRQKKLASPDYELQPGEERISSEQLQEWLDGKLEETIDVPGLQSIKLSEFPDGAGTPVGAVISGLMPILEEE